MELHQLAGRTVSLVGLGCNSVGARVDDERSIEVVHAALDNGITFYDTADVYGQGHSEEMLGKGLGSRRDDVVIATKFAVQMGDDPSHRGASPRWVKQAAEDSLRRLGTDRIDLYQQHEPDPDVPLEETLGALHELVEAGKVLALGCSKFTGDLIRQANGLADDKGLTPLRTSQNEYSLLARGAEQDVIPTCLEQGVDFLPFYPLGRGLLTGKYKRDAPLPPEGRITKMTEEQAAPLLSQENFDLVDRLTAFAADRGHTLLELAFAWLVAQPSVGCVIAGATSRSQIESNVAAAGWKLSGAELDEVDKLTTP